MRVIYSGGLPVDATDYRHTREVDGDYIEADVEGLDDVVSRSSLLRFTLDYPFQETFEGTVSSDAAPTLRHVFDAIRAGFRTMYAGATTEDVPGLHNKVAQGVFGRAVHDIGDLVIERIEIDDQTGELEIGIGS